MIDKLDKTVILTVVVFLCSMSSNYLLAQDTLSDDKFRLNYEDGITSLAYVAGSNDKDFLGEGNVLGNVMVSYRMRGDQAVDEWREVNTSDVVGTNGERRTSGPTTNSRSTTYNLGTDSLQLRFDSQFLLRNDGLHWNLHFQNETGQPLQIGDIALPLELKTDFLGSDNEETYEQRLMLHPFISGHGSFLYWGPANGEGPYLVMIPVEDTKLEYYDDDYEAYIHSGARGADKEGTWRQPHTTKRLGPKGTDTDQATYRFKLQWAESLQEVRDVLYQNESFDVSVVPGMVVPSDLSAKFSLRTKNNIESVEAEFSDDTQIDYLGEKREDTHIYQVSFSKLGENLLTVHYEDGRRMMLEFFSSEPIETLIKKRSNFIVNKQQYREPQKWYDGLYSLWDMENKILRGPEDQGNLRYFYMVGGSDDPSNGKAALISEKNVAFPNQREISSIEYHLENFVWGGLQRTDKEEPFSYGIYGINNWHVNRNYEWGTSDSSAIRRLEKMYISPNSAAVGQEQLWRSYDYPTYILTYYNMYKIAKQHPDMTQYLDASGYLKRAFGTAKAFFEVPYSIFMPGQPLHHFKGFVDWSYKMGIFHEKYIIDLVSALREEGWGKKADWLEGEWRKKVKYFIYDDPYAFGSEMPFDRTAFESTHALAKYALENTLQPDDSLWFDKDYNKWYSHPTVDRESQTELMGRQMKANIAMRGWLEPAYYFMGSARVNDTYSLDYMTQMGGWSILDYAMNYSEQPARHLRLGYASMLSAWSLMNTGTEKSDFGYWYPGEENDGAVGWGFVALKSGNVWGIVGDHPRGPWSYDGEIDHGLLSYIESARTIVANDPVFGWYAFGGVLEDSEGKELSVVPHDGVRQRLTIVAEETDNLNIDLNQDGFADGEPIVVDSDWHTVRFSLENRTRDRHSTNIYMSGLPAGTYSVEIDGNIIHSVNAEGEGVVIPVAVEENMHAVAIRKDS